VRWSRSSSVRNLGAAATPRGGDRQILDLERRISARRIPGRGGKINCLQVLDGDTLTLGRAGGAMPWRRVGPIVGTPLVDSQSTWNEVCYV
jgi:hypothetical protein